MNKIFVLVILTATVSGSWALKCYQCHNYMDGCPNDYPVECETSVKACASANLNIEDRNTKDNIPITIYGCASKFDDVDSCNSALKNIDTEFDNLHITGTGSCCTEDLCNKEARASRPRIPNLAKYIF